MIKRSLFILSILVFLFHLNAAGQERLFCTKIKDAEYVVDSTKFTVVSFNIVNTSNADIILWLDDQDVSELSTEQRIRHYFFTVKGDLSFSHQIYDNVANELPSVLYMSFIKKVKPKDVFSFNILVQSKLEREKIETFFKERLVCLSGYVFDDYIGIRMLDDYLFEESSIFLLYEHLR